MNPFNDEDRDTSNCVHDFVMRMAAGNTNHGFVAGPYRCTGGGGKSAKLNGFIGGKILE